MSSRETERRIQHPIALDVEELEERIAPTTVGANHVNPSNPNNNNNNNNNPVPNGATPQPAGN